MSNIAVIIGSATIQWSSLILTLGMVVALTLTLALYKPKNESTEAVWAFFALTCIIGFLLSRFMHYYFNAESYDSFISAMTNLSTGSYMLPGVLLGAGISALIVSALGLVSSPGRLLDFASPGILLFLAGVRLSALYNDSCRSKIIVKLPLLQRLPFAVSSLDNAGNTTWRMATFFIEFLLLLILTGAVLAFFFKARTRRMQPPCPMSGNVFRLALVAYGALEFVMDSTRNDSPLMHFRIFSSVNQYSAFISCAQVFAALTSVAVLIFYFRMSVKAKGFSWRQPVLTLMFLASLFGIGYLGEYRVQRYGTQKYLSCYSVMTLSCVILFLSVWLMYRLCLLEEEWET